ncbi:MAG: hypothetical protein NTY98_04390 [Verrucomicrobia bacterium]|nr:hypothetical protein [Verrucomicrobiota bacterium]
MNFRFIPLVLMLGVQAGRAQSSIEVPAGKDSADETGIILFEGIPIAKLPGGIPITEGKVTLFADYARAKKGDSIDVYLINRSDHDIVLNSQDGDVYLKLEAKNEDGTWTRAQPHAFSWCGNSYDFRPEVKKDCYYRIKGHQPKVGKAAKIRFRLYMQEGLDLATDAGEGIVSAEESALAATDALAVSTGSFELVRDLATGAKTMVNTLDHIRDMQGRAIRTLGSGRFAKEKVLPLLDEIEKKFPANASDVSFARMRLKEKEVQ